MTQTVSIKLDSKEVMNFLELINYGHSAVGHPGLVRVIKDQLIGQLVKAPTRTPDESPLKSPFKGIYTKRHVSPEGRKAISEAQRKRWAAYHKSKGAKRG